MLIPALDVGQVQFLPVCLGNGRRPPIASTDGVAHGSVSSGVLPLTSRAHCSGADAGASNRPGLLPTAPASPVCGAFALSGQHLQRQLAGQLVLGLPTGLDGQPPKTRGVSLFAVPSGPSLDQRRHPPVQRGAFLLRGRPWIDKGFFHSQIPEPAPPEWRRRSTGAAVAFCCQVLGNGIVRSNYLLGKRVHPETFLLQLAYNLIHTMIRLPCSSVVGHKGGYEVQIPVPGFRLMHPSGGGDGNPCFAQPINEALPFFDVHLYQYGLSHESTPCFLSVMAS
jgi:hypothetical protein